MKKILKKDQKDFFNKAKEIIETYKIKGVKEDKGWNYECIVETVLGDMAVSIYEDNIFCYTAFMRFRYHDVFSLEEFQRFFSKNEQINKYSLKWNIHNSDMEYVLNELDERLNNLQFITDRENYNLILNDN